MNTGQIIGIGAACLVGAYIFSATIGSLILPKRDIDERSTTDGGTRRHRKRGTKRR